MMQIKVDSEKEILLVADGNIAYDDLFRFVKDALMGGVDKLILTNPGGYTDYEMARLVELCHNYEAEAIIHNDEDYAHEQDCDGVHFDELPKSFQRNTLVKNFRYGVSISDNLDKFKEVVDAQVDFVVFGDVASDGVEGKLNKTKLNSIRQAAKNEVMPMYVLSEITDDAIQELKKLEVTGVVIYADITKTSEITAEIKKLKASLYT